MSGLYIRRFIDKLQQLELKGSKDFTCPIADAKNLHSDITKLLLDLDHVKSQSQDSQQKKEEVIQIEVGGGTF